MLEVDWNTVGVVFALVIYGVLAAIALGKSLKAALARMGAMPRLVQVALAVVAVVATVEAQKPGNGVGTNEPPRSAPAPQGGTQGGGSSMESAARRADLSLDALSALAEATAARIRAGGLLPVRRMESPRLRAYCPAAGDTVTSNDVARGWRVVCETNDWGHSFAMPSNATYVGNWHVHGGHRSLGRLRVEFGDWAFPLGSGNDVHSAFWYTLDGRLRLMPFAPEGEISCVGADMFASPGVSRMWTATGEGDSRIVTWEDFYVARAGTNELVCAQIELCPDGDFVVWSNEVAKVCKRIDQNDWDGDGLSNEIDAEPMVSAGDCFGTGVDWLNANCGGILSASTDTNGDLNVEWSTNANPSAYYWLYFTATHDGTRVAITCDGESSLGNMVVIADEGQECAVPLLIGPSYDVLADRSLADIYASDPDAVITLWRSGQGDGGEGQRLLRSGGGIGPSDYFSVLRPIALVMSGDGGCGCLSTLPDVGAEILSVTGNCCSVELDGSNYVWNCGNCHCSGYEQRWRVTAVWEGYSRLFDWWMQCDCQINNEQNPQAWAEISATSVVFLDGDMGRATASFNPPSSAGGATATLRGGSHRVSLWTTTNHTGAVSLPLEVPAGGGISFCIEGVSRSDSVGDVEFYLDIVSGDSSCTITQSVTVAEVTRMDVTSQVAGASANPPPFFTGVDYPFCVTNSLSPDRHLVVPFGNVATLGPDGFVVAPFHVDMTLIIEPADVPAAGVGCDWEVVEAIPQMSGSLVPMPGAAARFVNPTQGGVYRFRGRCGGSPWTQANVVLPLSGASIDAVFFSDMAAYECQMAALVRMPDAIRQTRDFGYEWFNDGGASDYIGRVDSNAKPTVWHYNQVSDDLLTMGMGAVAMWRGVPVRIAKLGNFLAGYGTKRLGISESSRIRSQSIGTENDATAEMSWQGGGDAFTNGELMSVTGALATNMWPVADMKVKRLWPNNSNCDNHVEAGQYFDHNFFFCSPRTVERGRVLMQQQGE